MPLQRYWTISNCRPAENDRLPNACRCLLQGSLADDELQYLFQAGLSALPCMLMLTHGTQQSQDRRLCVLQLTSQLGEQVELPNGPGTSPQGPPLTNTKHSPATPSIAADDNIAVRQSRTTADLLNWADDVAAVSCSLLGSGSAPGDELNDLNLDDLNLNDINLEDPAVMTAVATIAEGVPGQGMTSSQAAARALLKAARQGRGNMRTKATPSRYMDGKLPSYLPSAGPLITICCNTCHTHCFVEAYTVMSDVAFADAA